MPIVALIRRHLLLQQLRIPSHFLCWALSIAGAALVFLAAGGMRLAGVRSWWAHPMVGPVVVFGLLLRLYYGSRRRRARTLEQMAVISQAAERLREALDILQVAGASEIREALDHITWVLKDALPEVNGGLKEGANLHRDRFRKLELQVRNALVVLHNLDVLMGEAYRARALAGAIQMLEKGLAK